METRKALARAYLLSKVLHWTGCWAEMNVVQQVAWWVLSLAEMMVLKRDALANLGFHLAVMSASLKQKDGLTAAHLAH